MILSPYLKAIYGAVIAGYGAVDIAGLDGQFTARELIHAGFLTLGALGVIFGVPNVDRGPGSESPVGQRYDEPSVYTSPDQPDAVGGA